MDSIENQIRDYIASERQVSGIGKRAKWDYPTEQDLYHFVMDRLSESELKKMTAHLKIHPEDQALVLMIRGLLGRIEEAEKETVPASLLTRVRSRIPQKDAASCPHCQKPITPFKKPLSRQRFFNLLWLAAGLVLFTLSFFIRHFFIQCIILGALCMMKWIVDQKSTKTQILIYKALSQESNEREHLHRTESHL